MKRFFILSFLAIMFSYVESNVYGRNRVIITSKLDLETTLAQENTQFKINEYIDLGGKTIIVGQGSQMAFKGGLLRNGTIILGRNCVVSNGRFQDVTITIESGVVLKNCLFENPNINTCISTNNLTSKTNINIDGCEFVNVGNNLTTSSSVHCIYLNSSSCVLVKDCKFNNIGNLFSQKVSGISVNTSNQKEGKELILREIKVTSNTFNNMISRSNISGDSHNTGEYHFIILSSSEDVLVKNNTIKNETESIGYGKEAIYLKCTDAIVKKNTIEGSFSGEAVICVKNYTKENVSVSPNADIINNKILGTFFAAIYHTGNGIIMGNTIVNSQAYAISCENNRSEDGHTFVIEKNTIRVGTIVPEVSTGTARAPITLLSYENKPVKVIMKKNTIQSDSQIETIRCRFAYDIDLELNDNSINTNGKVVSFANLSGYEKSFKLKTHGDAKLKDVLIQQPKSSRFITFDVTNE